MAEKTLLLTVNVIGTSLEAGEQGAGNLFGKFGHGRYAYTHGIARLLDLFQRRSLRATFFWPVYEAQGHLELLRACVEAGHEIAHLAGMAQDFSTLGAEEAAHHREQKQLLEGLASVPVRGFRAVRHGFSPATLDSVAALYEYDASSIDDDLPYRLDDLGHPGLWELPWSEGLSDARYYEVRMAQDRVEQHMREELQASLQANGFACLCLNPRADMGSGRAARIQMVERLLDYASQFHPTRTACCADVLAMAAA